MDCSLQTVTATLYGCAGLTVALSPRYWATLLGNGAEPSSVAVATSQGLGLQAMTVAWLYGNCKMTRSALYGFAAMMIPFFAWDIYWAKIAGLHSGIWADLFMNIFWVGSALYSAKKIKNEKDE